MRKTQNKRDEQISNPTGEVRLYIWHLYLPWGDSSQGSSGRIRAEQVALNYRGRTGGSVNSYTPETAAAHRKWGAGEELTSLCTVYIFIYSLYLYIQSVSLYTIYNFIYSLYLYIQSVSPYTIYNFIYSIYCTPYCTPYFIFYICFSLMFSTYCVFMFYVVCYLYAPLYQEQFQVGVNLLGNKQYLILISSYTVYIFIYSLYLHIQSVSSYTI